MDIPEKGKVVVEFEAPWCGPCQFLAPVLKKVTEEMNLKLLKVDVDQDSELATKYNVRAIPTVIVFDDGKPVNQFTGALPSDKIREFLKD